MTSTTTGTDVAVARPPGSPGLALAALTGVFILANIDRNILSILLEDVRREFVLADWQLGLLSGLAFSLIYGVGGLFVSFLADRGGRALIIAMSLGVWSIMTMLCGAAGSFVMLALARAGVGLGESGCSPPAHALIADLFKPERCAFAMGIYAAGASVGLTLSYIVGGWLGDVYGWRTTFIVVGALGIPLAFALPFLVTDPRPKIARSASDVGLGTALIAAVANVWGTPSLRHVYIAASLAAGVSAASIMFIPAFLMRTHGLTATETGLVLGLLTGIIGSSGIILGGWLTDRLARSDERWRLWIPGLAKVLPLPFLAAFFLIEDTTLALVAYAVPSFLSGVWLGPTYAIVQTLVDPARRAMAAALLLLTYNLIGFSFGPLLIGGLSDLLREATGADSLRLALLCLTPFSIWTAVHYYLASRSLRTALAARAS